MGKAATQQGWIACGSLRACANDARKAAMSLSRSARPVGPRFIWQIWRNNQIEQLAAHILLNKVQTILNGGQLTPYN